MRILTGGGDASPALALDAPRRRRRSAFVLPAGTAHTIFFASLPGHNGVFDIFLGALNG